MKCDIKKEKLIGYFYQDDLSSEDKKLVETHLPSCAICRKTLDDFRETAGLLRAWTDEEPHLDLSFVKENVGLWKSFQKAWSGGNGWRRLVIGFATGLAAVVVVLSLFNFEASYADGSFGLKLSLLPRPQTAATVADDPLEMPVTKREFNVWQERSARFIQQMIETTEQRQHRSIDLRLAQYAKELEARRLYDLQVVGEGLEVFQLSNENRFRRTDHTLQELIRLAQYRSSQPLENK